MADAQYTDIEVTELKRRLEVGESIMIIDVRNPDEFSGEKGHIPSARNLPFAHMPAVLGQIADAKHLSIAINCGSAGRSERAAKLMINAGFQNISVHRVI